MWQAEKVESAIGSETMTGAEVKALRKAAGLTQGALARRLGVQLNTVYRYERGLIRVTPSMAKLIRVVLGKR